MSLTVPQSIGIGITAGFVGGVVLAIVFGLLGYSPCRPARPEPKEEEKLYHFSNEECREHVLLWGNGQWPPDRELGLTFHARLEHRLEMISDRERLEDVTAMDGGLWWLGSSMVDDDCDPEAYKALLDEDRLVALAGPPVNGIPWVECISGRAIREAAVTCFLSQIMIKRMHPSCSIENSLLPTKMLSYYKDLEGFRRFREPGCKVQLDALEGRLPVFREVACAIHLEEYGMANMGRISDCLHPCRANDPRRGRWEEGLEEILDALHIDKVHPPDQSYDECLDGLIGAVGTAANIALVLFSQSGEWEYDWVPAKPGFMTYPRILLNNRGWKVVKPADVNEWATHYLRTYRGFYTDVQDNQRVETVVEEPAPRADVPEADVPQADVPQAKESVGI